MEAGDPGDERKAREYAERFPSFNFVSGLEALDEQRIALGLGADWERSLYNEPMALLLRSYNERSEASRRHLSP